MVHLRKEPCISHFPQNSLLGNELHYTATIHHKNTLQQHTTRTHCNNTHCSTLQHMISSLFCCGLRCICFCLVIYYLCHLQYDTDWIHLYATDLVVWFIFFNLSFFSMTRIGCIYTLQILSSRTPMRCRSAPALTRAFFMKWGKAITSSCCTTAFLWKSHSSWCVCVLGGVYVYTHIYIYVCIHTYTYNI